MTAPQLIVITATSDRPVGFARCEHYMAQQTRPPDRWLVVDDGQQPAQCQAGQEHLRQPWIRNPVASFRRNMAVALAALRHGRGLVVFVEDDDYYAPTWLDWCWRQYVEGALLIGECPAMYYNVAARRYHVNRNRGHASLCQTAFSTDLLRHVRIAQRRSRGVFFDRSIWRIQTSRRRLELTRRWQVVGIKGLPGKAGLGIGHRMQGRPNCPHDPDGRQLRQWIGEDATRWYLDLQIPAACPMPID